jgi:cytochrome d ubiquinol oxidase subunit II
MIVPSAALVLAAVMLAALIVYVLLGGADFGAGVWDLLARGPRAAAQRELIAHAIGPVWEANHVWLIVVIVLLFTGFPSAFTAIMTALHVPLSLMLVAIVLRGSAFTFRSYDDTDLSRRRWNRLFSVPSVVAPVLLGIVVGAVATGKVGAVATRSGSALLWDAWLGPFPLAVGLWTLALCAFLAAVYLTLETTDPALRDDFRARALAAGVLVGALAWVVYRLAPTEAPWVARDLRAAPWALGVRVATGAAAITALVALWRRWFHVARVAAVAQVALILSACGLAQYPYLVPPGLTIDGSAAPTLILRLLLGALALGSLVLLPSLFVLFRIFKGHTFALGQGKAGVGTPP